MKLLSIAASYRPDSFNRMLVDHAAKIANGLGAAIEPLDYASVEAPIYRELDNALPAGVIKLKAAIARNDGILLASPEYNWSMPGSLKNLIDWLSVDSTEALRNKSILLLSASPTPRGGRLGLTQLRVPLEVLGGFVFPRVVCVGNAKDILSVNSIGNEREERYLVQTVTDFITYTGRICG